MTAIAQKSRPLSDNMRPVVLSATNFVGVEPIDGGDTVAMRFTAPEGREVVVLVPRQATSILQAQLAEVLAETSHLDRIER